MPPAAHTVPTSAAVSAAAAVAAQIAQSVAYTVIFLIGFILGGDLEDYFIQVLTAYNGYLTGLFVRPMAWVIWALIILSIVYAILDNRKAKRQEKEMADKK